MGARIMKVRAAGTFVLGTATLYLILTFFQWQHFRVHIAITVRWGFSEWHGVGVIACSVVIALIVWEVARSFVPRLPWAASVSPAFVSLSLSVLLFLFTLLTFLSRGSGRQWPAWAGLALSIVIALAAIPRAKAEGVELFRITQPTRPEPERDPDEAHAGEID
jgi:hypothetical protein